MALNHRHFSCAALSDGELEDRHAAGAEQARVADFGDDRGHFSRAQFGDGARIQAVFVAEGQIVQQVIDGVNTFGGQHFGQAWANALDDTARSGRFQHRSDGSRSRMRVGCMCIPGPG